MGEIVNEDMDTKWGKFLVAKKDKALDFTKLYV
jgi:hypothetical protein